MTRCRVPSVLGLIVALALWTPTAGADEQAQIDFANGLFGRGFYEEAADEYKAYLEQYPSGAHRASALYRLGESGSAAGKYEEALRAFDAFLKEEGGAGLRERVRLRRGVALYQLEKFSDALPILEDLSKTAQEDAIVGEALYYLGKLHFEAGRHDGAVAAFKALSQRGGESALVPYGRYQLAFVYLAKGDNENAAIEFSEAASDSRAEDSLRMECRFRAAETYDKIGWFDAAVKAYEQLRSEFPASDYARKAAYGYVWALYHAGKYQDAFAGANELLAKFQESPLRPGVLYLQGNCLQQQKRHKDAIAMYRKIASEYPGSDFAKRAQYKTAWALYLDGRTQEAKTEVRAFLKSGGKMALMGDAAFLLGTIEASDENYEDAYEEFRLVAEKYPQSEFAAEALYKSAESLAQLGYQERAGAAFERFARTYPDDPLAPEAILRAADAHFLGGSYDESVARYREILSGNPSPKVEEETFYRMAVSYHNLKEYKASAQAFDRIVEKFPASAYVAEARFRVGEYYLRDAKEALRAIEYYQAAHKAAPGGPYAGRALNGLALARMQTKDFDGAAETFLRVMSKYPKISLNTDIYEWVGQHLYDREEWDQAALAFETLLEQKSDYAGPERILFKIAQSIAHLSKPDAAIGKFQAVIDAAPKSAMAVEAKYHIGELYERLKRPDDALRFYADAADANNGNTAALARFRLAELYEEQGKLSEAARNYMRVAILFLHEELSPESLWRAGQCFEKSNDGKRAAKTYEGVIREYPDTVQAKKAKDRLASLNAQ